MVVQVGAGAGGSVRSAAPPPLRLHCRGNWKRRGQGHCGPVATGGFHLGSVPGVIFFKSTAADST